MKAILRNHTWAYMLGFMLLVYGAGFTPAFADTVYTYNNQPVTGWRLVATGASALKPFTSAEDFQQLTGQRLCINGVPNAGNILLLSHYPSPSPRPELVISDSWNETLMRFQGAECVAAVIPDSYVEQLARLSLSVVVLADISSDYFVDLAMRSAPLFFADNALTYVPDASMDC